MFAKSFFWILKKSIFSARTGAIFADYLIAREQNILKNIDLKDRLLDFFNELKIPYEKSNMSFSVSIKNSRVEYGGSGLKALFANKLNIFNLQFLLMIKLLSLRQLYKADLSFVQNQ